jgi:hypothetical protein
MLTSSPPNGGTDNGTDDGTGTDTGTDTGAGTVTLTGRTVPGGFRLSPQRFGGFGRGR